jgi:hypothetical protein
MDQLNEPAMTWLTVAEAVPRMGLTVDGLRSRIKRRLAKTKRGNDGRVLVNVAMDGSELGRGPSHEPAMNGSDDREPERDLLPDLLKARDRAARAEAALVEVRAALAREQACADRLEAELAEARKGWLERLLGAVRKR